MKKKMFAKALGAIVLSAVLALGVAVMPAESDVLAISAEAADSVKVEHITETSYKTSVKLKWDKVNGATGYLVLQYSPKKKDFLKVMEVRTNSATIKKLKSGTWYNFKIVPMKNGKKIGKTADASIKKVKTKGAVKSTEAKKAMSVLGKYFDDLPTDIAVYSSATTVGGEYKIDYYSRYGEPHYYSDGTIAYWNTVNVNSWEECDYMEVYFDVPNRTVAEGKLKKLLKKYEYSDSYYIEEENGSGYISAYIYDDYGKIAVLEAGDYVGGRDSFLEIDIYK